MAGIDKTYATKQELIEVIDWCISVGDVVLEDGYKFRPLDFVYGYNGLDDNYRPGIDKDEYVVWNTPVWFDRWLWMNCPLKFIKNRILEQYGDDGVKEFENFVYKDPNDNPNLGKQKYTFLKEPKWHDWKWWANNMRRNNPYKKTLYHNSKQATIEMEINLPGDTKDWINNTLAYCSTVDRWYKEFTGFMNVDKSLMNYMWQQYHRCIPSKKTIIRTLRKWYFPSGTIVKISGIKLNVDWEILVK